MILHVTSGDCAGDKLAAAFPRDVILPWRDVLHDGPVPASLSLRELSEVRAEFLGEPGCFAERDATLERHVEFDETVLWFEHDLYDQLQLIQVLDSIRDTRARVTLVQADDYLGDLASERLKGMFPRRVPVSAEQYELASSAWFAFRASDPNELTPFLEPNPALPWLALALRRFCEEFPSVEDGLTRTERVVRDLRARGITDRVRLFEEFQKTEEPKFMGDTSFFRILDGARRAEWLWDASATRFVRRPS